MTDGAWQLLQHLFKALRTHSTARVVQWVAQAFAKLEKTHPDPTGICIAHENL